MVGCHTHETEGENPVFQTKKDRTAARAMSSPMPCQLNIRELQEELHAKRDKCQDIGIQLGLDDDALRQIEESYPDSSNQLRHVLRLWLGKGDASWSKLVTVLRHPVIDEKVLAEKLEAKYCPSLATQSSKTSLVADLDDSVSSDNAPTSSTTTSATKNKSYGKEYFVRPPPPERLCAQCNRVPTDPMRAECCDTIYCTDCSSAKTRCIVHSKAIVYILDKHLKRQIAETTVHCIHCKNWKMQARHLKDHLSTCPNISDATSSVEQSSDTDHAPSPVPRSQLSSSDGEPSSVLSNGLLGRKRPLPSDSDADNSINSRPGPSIKVPRLDPPEASNEFRLPAYLGKELFLVPPKPEHKCSICHRVPQRAMKAKCCGRICCKPCASTAKTCPVHKLAKFVLHAELNQEIARLTVRCPNYAIGCLWKKPVNQLKNHLLNHCTIPCPYSSLGCKESVTNASITEHLQKSVIEHLDQVRQGVTTLSDLNSRLVNLENQVSVQSTPPQSFLVPEVSKHVTATSGWISPSFYSHQFGCKLHLVLWLSSSQSILNLELVHDEGVNDDMLKWPCKGKVTIKIVNHGRKKLNFTLDKAAGSSSSHTFPLLRKESSAPFTLNDVLCLKVEIVSLESPHLGWGWTDV